MSTEKKEINLVELVDSILNLKLIEVIKLIENIETIFKINSSLILGSKKEENTPAKADSVPVEEKLTFQVTLTEVPADKKVAILKIVRNVTELGLKESKDIVDNIPKLLKDNIIKSEAEKIKKDIESAGGKAIIT